MKNKWHDVDIVYIISIPMSVTQFSHTACPILQEMGRNSTTEPACAQVEPGSLLENKRGTAEKPKDDLAYFPSPLLQSSIRCNGLTET